MPSKLYSRRLLSNLIGTTRELTTAHQTKESISWCARASWWNQSPRVNVTGRELRRTPVWVYESARLKRLCGRPPQSFKWSHESWRAGHTRHDQNARQLILKSVGETTYTVTRIIKDLIQFSRLKEKASSFKSRTVEVHLKNRTRQTRTRARFQPIIPFFQVKRG